MQHAFFKEVVKSGTGSAAAEALPEASGSGCLGVAAQLQFWSHELLLNHFDLSNLSIHKYHLSTHVVHIMVSNICQVNQVNLQIVVEHHL